MPEDKPYLTGRTYLFRLEKGSDVIESLQDFCHNNQIKCGVISAIGALTSITFGFFNQKAKKYDKTTIKGEFEILNITGNISLMEERPMVHAHITVSSPDGKVTGGHLMAGATVHACEVFVQELVGNPKCRKSDKATGLPLWTNNHD